jgi:hypothetical protein
MTEQASWLMNKKTVEQRLDRLEESERGREAFRLGFLVGRMSQ